MVPSKGCSLVEMELIFISKWNVIQEVLCGIVVSLFYMSFSAKWYVDVTHVSQTLFFSKGACI